MNKEIEDTLAELAAIRLENGALRANREQYDEHALELEATIERLTKTGSARLELAEKLAPMTKDELELVGLFIAKINGEGRSEHGGLDHESDERSIADWMANQSDELFDSFFYSLGKRARRAKGHA